MDPITTELSRNGVWLVGLNVLLQQLGLPIPAVPTMMLAGALAMTARFDIVSAFAIAVAAARSCFACDAASSARHPRFANPATTFRFPRGRSV